MLTLNITYANEVIQQLDARMKSADTLVCVGLDPDPTKIPHSILSTSKTVEEAVLRFLSQIVDITQSHVCCYKIQKAFFDQYDHGHALLADITDYIHKTYPGIPVFVDCKVGDTDNTMQTYMHILFDQMKLDGVVINPYMGDDVLEPFLNDPKKVAIVLIQTSNPRGKVVQELKLANGNMLWQEMLEISLNRWNQNKNLIFVLSSNTATDNYTNIRKLIPQETPILLAGIGSQGGNPEVLRQLLNRDKRGVFVNSSRGILYPYAPESTEWESEVLKAVTELKSQLNQIRYGDQ